MRARSLLFVALLGSGCSSFGTSDASDAVDGGAPPSADAGPADAAAAEAASPGAGCVAPSCESFETNSWMKQWAPTGTGVAVTEGRSTSGTHAIDLALSSNTKTAFVRSLGTARHVVASMQIVVDKRGDGELDFFSISETAEPGSKGIHITHLFNEKAFVVEIEPSAKLTRDVRPLAQAFADFTRVRMDVDLTTHKLSMLVGDEPVEADLDLTWMPAVLYVQAGSLYATNIVPWHIRFDDADILIVP